MKPYEVIINSNLDNRKWRGHFDSRESAQKWLNKQLQKKGRRQAVKVSGIQVTEDHIESAVKIEEIEDAFGDIKKIYTLPPECSYEIIDNSKKIKENEYKELRKREYPTINQLVVALIEKEEGRPEALNELKIKRKQIKEKYPKPEIK